jgi:hypothetical protein
VIEVITLRSFEDDADAQEIEELTELRLD